MIPGSNKSSVFYVVDDFGGCGWYRCHVPGMELKRRGHFVLLDNVITPQQAEAADIIVFQRQWHEEALRAFRWAKANGKLVVYELDDDLWNVDPTNPSYQAWNTPHVIGGAETMLHEADVVTTTTPVLARQLRRFNDEVRILPNMLPQEHWQAVRERADDYAKIVIGWAGSVARAKDLEVVRDVVVQVLDRYPETELLIAGDESNIVFPIRDGIFRMKPVMIELYAGMLAHFDIGIAPVVDSKFNQAKSDLKFVEYGMLGLPVVVSHVEAYSHSIVNGENGFLAKNAKDWLKYLRRLVEDAELRDEMGRKAKEFAESRTIDKNIGLWEKAYGIPVSGPVSVS
jgi:glycosyltransferase involved in cell wall biosynthesis